MNINKIEPKEFVPVAKFTSVPEFSVLGESYTAIVRMYDADSRYLGKIENGINEGEYNNCIADSEYAKQYIYSRLGISPTGEVLTIEG